MKNIIDKKRLLAWGLLILLPCMGLMAQFNFAPTQYHSYSFQPQNLGIATPQTADFQRYGNIPVNHYNGLLDLEIALDGYKDKDFDLPMSLKYISNGFIPSKRPSIVGMNWVLNFGGVITRTVRGSADDVLGNYVKDDRSYIKNGLLTAIRMNEYVYYTDEQLTSFSMPKNKHHYDYTDGDFNHDLEPDIFSFNFGSHQGKFFIDRSGKVICLQGEAYKIDISGVATQSYSTTEAPVASTIKVTTPDGYIYEFGGDRNYLEYNIPNNPDKAAVRPRHIISWYLKSIKSPNNRQATFVYESKLLPNHYNYYMYARKTVGGYTSDNDTFGTDDDEAAKIEVKDKVYSPIIKEVRIDNTKLIFGTVAGVAFFDANDPTYCISKIAIYRNSDLIKEHTFEYETKGKYIFLKKLNKNGEVYNFDYYSFTPPSPLTISVDHWGYWNGGYETDVTDIRSYCQNLETNRATKNSYADVGLLKTIKYPTGGTSTIYYEKNTYSKYFKRVIIYMNSVDVYRKPEDLYCGGSRVKK